MPGKRRQGGQKKQWLDDITQWSGQSLVDMVRLAEDSVTELCTDHMEVAVSDVTNEKVLASYLQSSRVIFTL